MKPSLISTVPPVVSILWCLHGIDSNYPEADVSWKEAAKFYKNSAQKLLADLAQLPNKISAN